MTTPTRGDKAVRRSFNPSQMPEVAAIKEAAANLYDVIEANAPGCPDRSVALRDVRSASMWAVAAATEQVGA